MFGYTSPLRRPSGLRVSQSHGQPENLHPSGMIAVFSSLESCLETFAQASSCLLAMPCHLCATLRPVSLRANAHIKTQRGCPCAFHFELRTHFLRVHLPYAYMYLCIYVSSGAVGKYVRKYVVEQLVSMYIRSYIRTVTYSTYGFPRLAQHGCHSTPGTQHSWHSTLGTLSTAHLA